MPQMLFDKGKNHQICPKCGQILAEKTHTRWKESLKTKQYVYGAWYVCPSANCQYQYLPNDEKISPKELKKRLEGEKKQNTAKKTPRLRSGSTLRSEKTDFGLFSSIKQEKPADIVRVFTDGATCGHNGKLGSVKWVGLGVYSPDIDLKLKKKSPGMSNNEAEFLALLLAMKELSERGIKNVAFFLDSMVVTRRANGHVPNKRYKNERMDVFQNNVLLWAKKFDYVTYEHVPREQNQHADALSKAGCGL